MSKRIKPPAKPFNPRKTVVFDETTFNRGIAIARADKNSFSKELRVLVDREYDRIFTAANKSQTA